MIRRKKTMNLELETLGKEECGEPKAFNLEHAHERDSHVHFFPEKHIYTFDNQFILSIISVGNNLYLYTLKNNWFFAE